MKRLLKSLAMMLMLLMLLPGNRVEAAEIVESGTCGDNLTWTLDDEGTLVISGEGPMYWTSFPKTITKVIIEEGISEIGNSAFSNCGELTEIVLPSSLTEIDAWAFEGCSSLVEIEIPSGITNIGHCVFYECGALEKIELPSGLTSIEDGAFQACSSLKEIILPAGVIYIGDGAFYGCKSLEKIEIPSGITSLGDNIFRSCSSLKELKLPSELKSIGEGAFFYCVGLTEIELPSGITDIGFEAFSGCSSLTKIELPSGITSIGDYAFYDCSSLIEIELPLGITDIGDWAFCGCSSLTEIKLPSGITSIGDRVFYGCSSLREIELPSGITSIGYYVFYGCSSLKEIELPSEITSMGSYAFYGCSSLTEIELPSGITGIGVCAFSDCSSLTEIELPSGITFIGNRAFSGCSSLTEIELPSGITSIWGRAFFGCSSLKEIRLPSGIINMGDYVFDGCELLEIICYKKSVAYQYAVEHNIPYRLVSGNMEALPGDGDNGGGQIYVYSSETNNEYSSNENYVLEKASYTELGITTNLVNQYKTITLDYPEGIINGRTITVDCRVKGDDELVREYILYQGRRKLASSETGKITVSLDEDCVGTDFYVVVIDLNGGRTKTAIQLEVKTFKEGKGSEVQLGGENYLSVKLPEDIPFFGGAEFELDAYVLPVFVAKTEEGGIRVGVNIKKDMLKDNSLMKEFKEEWDDLLKLTKWTDKMLVTDWSTLEKFVQMPSHSANFDKKKLEFMFVGYGEGSYDEQGNIIASVTLMCSVSGSHTWGHQFIVPVVVQVPVVVEATVSFEGELEGELVWKWSDSGIDFQSGDSCLKLEGGIKVFGGVGLRKIIAGGVYGSGKLESEIVLLSSKREAGVESFDLTLEAGLKGYIGPLKAECVLANKTWNIYSRSGKAAGYTYMTPFGEEVYSIYDESIYHLADTYYSAEFVGEEGTAGTIIEDAFLSAQPAIASTEDYTVMAYLAMDENRPMADSTVLMYSVYDKEQATWSAPAQVDTDATMDWTPMLYSDGETIRLVYTQQDALLPEDLEISDLTTGMKVTTAVFDEATMSFLQFEDVAASSDTVYVSRPAVTEHDGVPTIVWVQGPTGDYFGVNSENSIYYSSHIEGGWTAPAMLAENLNCVTELAVGMLCDEEAVAYITDGDNDLETIDDRGITLISFTGTQVEVASGEVDNLLFEVLPNKTTSALVWYEAGNMGVLESIGAEPTVLFGTDENGVMLNSVTRDFRILNNRIMYNVTDGEGVSTIYSIGYENGTYTAAVPAVKASGTVTSFSADEDMAVWVDTEATVLENSVEDYSTIEYCMYQEQYDIAALYANYEQESLVPGEELTVTVGVKNNSLEVLDAVDVTILDENENSVLETSAECEIASGAEGEVAVTITAPETLDTAVYTVKVSGLKTDTALEDNTTNLDMSYTDLAVSTREVIHEDKGYVVVDITNESYVVANGTLTLTDMNGEVLHTEEVDEIPAKGTYSAVLDLSELLEEGENSKIISVSFSMEAEEFSALNNSLLMNATRLSAVIPYVTVVFRNGEEEVSSNVYDVGTDIVPEELPENALGWYELGDEAKTLVTDFTNITTDKVYVAKYEDTALAVPEKPYKIVNVVSGVHVYWDEIDGVEKYGLWRSETGKNGTYKWIANPTVPHFTDTKVTTGTTYFYKVTVMDVDANKHGERSEAIGITYVSTPDISSRVNVADGVLLGWEPVDGALGYAIYRKSFSGADAWKRIATIEGTETLSYTDTSVATENGTIYRYTIRALVGSNLKTLSGCRNTGRTMMRLLTRTMNSAVAVDDSSVKCTWTTTAKADGYEVSFVSDTGKETVFTVGNYKTGVKTFKDLASGNYFVKVRAYKKVADVGSFYSGWSEAVKVALNTGPVPPPEDLTVPEKPYKITNVVSGVHVYWDKVVGVEKYGLWRSETGIDGTYKWIANPTVPHFTDTKVESGKTYYYKVTTMDVNHNIHSLKSEAIGVTYVATPDISNRVNVAEGVALSWKAVEGACGYAIYRKTYDGTDAWARIATIESPDIQTYTDTSVVMENGVAYRYTIRALVGSNLKTLSGCRNTGRSMVRLTNRRVTDAVAVNSTSVKVSWETTAKAAGYEIQVIKDGTVVRTVKVNDYKTGTKTIDKLVADTMYEVQVRSYKTISDVGTFYSEWSEAVSVATKK